MIEGVKTKELKIIKDERGFLMEILRSDDELFKKFGQVYISVANHGYVKAWHYHKIQTDNFVCVKGKARVGLYDNREGSKTKGNAQEFILSFDNPVILQIPPGVFHGFEAAGEEEACVLNIPTEVYNYDQPDELRADPFDNKIPFKWNACRGS